MKSKLLLVLTALSTLFAWAQIPTTGLIKDYKFTNGALTSDVNPTLQVGTPTLVPIGSARTQISDRNSEANNAVLLGGDSFIAGSTNSLVNNFAISLWVKTSTDDASTRYILDQFQTTATSNGIGGFSLSLKNGMIDFKGQYNYNKNGTYTSGALAQITSGVISDGLWHHVFCQVASTSSVTGTTNFSYNISYVYTMYIDNVIVNSVSRNSNSIFVNAGVSFSRRAINPNQQLNIGRSIYAENLGYNDAIDQIRYYETTLNLASIQALYLEGKRFYVNQNATGSNNGTSWANAYTDINGPLSFATPTNEIWVAAGTYKPNGTARTSSFGFYKGMKLYGGFDGTETLFSQRKPKINTTILSGDINGDDNATITDAETTRQDNAYHVLSVVGNVQDLIVDGFTISGGNANGPILTSLAAASQYYHTRGGALYINTYTDGDNPKVYVANCIFEKNSGSDTGVVSPYFANGVLNQSYTANFDACIFKNNFSGTNSQILYAGTNAYNWLANGEIKNCLFNNNTSTSGASCLYLSANANGGSITGLNIDVINTTFASNTGVSGNVIKTVDGSNARIKNSILYNNGSATPFTIGGFGSPALSNTISQGGQISGIDSDPLLSATFELQAGSSGINSGNNVSLPANTDFDLAGNTRIVNTTVDLGAYEYDANLGNTNFDSFSDFTVYPNPAKSTVTIQSPEPILKVTLYSIQGREMFITNQSQIDISDLANGIYFMTVTTNKGSGSKKIIKG